jgi:hypothetical protein
MDASVEHRLLELQAASMFAVFDADGDRLVSRAEWVQALTWHELRGLMCYVAPGSGARAVVLPGGAGLGWAALGWAALGWEVLPAGAAGLASRRPRRAGWAAPGQGGGVGR